jgi:hypothetical protein
MLTASPVVRQSVLPGTQNLRQRRAIHAYVQHGRVADPMTQWELDRAERASALVCPAAAPATTTQAEASVESDTPWPRLILGAAAVLTLWAFVGWAMAPLSIRAIAWGCKTLADLFGATA